MISIRHIVITAIVLSTFHLPAQEVCRRHNNTFYLGLTDIYFSTIQLGFEHTLSNYNTLVLQGGFKLSKKESYYDRLGATGELQYRINLLYNKEAVSKIAKRYCTFPYFAPFLHYRYEEITGKSSSDESLYDASYVHSGFAGVLFGFRLTGMENRFCLNVYGGGGLKLSDTRGLNKYDGFLEPGYTGLSPKLGIQVGIAF